MTEPGIMQSTVQEITTALKDKPGALLTILHGVQDALGTFLLTVFRISQKHLIFLALKCMESLAFTTISGIPHPVNTPFICAAQNLVNPWAVNTLKIM